MEFQILALKLQAKFNFFVEAIVQYNNKQFDTKHASLSKVGRYFANIGPQSRQLANVWPMTHLDGHTSLAKLQTKPLSRSITSTWKVSSFFLFFYFYFLLLFFFIK